MLEEPLFHSFHRKQVGQEYGGQHYAESEEVEN
jgi:hypothetical protein